MALLQQLAETFAQLAETGNDAELEEALDLCLGFTDRLMRERNDEPLAELSESGSTQKNPIRWLN